MPVTTIAGVFAEIIRRGVAAGAGNVMWPRQSKEPPVVDGRGGPVGLAVTGAALRRHPSVDDGRRRRVTARAGRPRRWGQHRMGKYVAMRGRKARKRDQRPLPTRDQVTSRNDITPENNVRIRPQQDRDNAFAGASGGSGGIRTHGRVPPTLS